MAQTKIIKTKRTAKKKCAKYKLITHNDIKIVSKMVCVDTWKKKKLLKYVKNFSKIFMKEHKWKETQTL